MYQKILYLKTILNAEQFVLTGSNALKLMGFDVTPKDIDVILYNPAPGIIEIMESLAKQYPPTRPGKYPTPNTYRWKQEGTDVDVFVEKTIINSSLMTKEGIFVNPIQRIVIAKINFRRLKDWSQLKHLANQIFNRKAFEQFFDEARLTKQ